MKKGFTLIELLVTIVVLGLIILIIVPQSNKIVEKSRNDAFLETKRNIEAAAQLYRIKNSNLFPDEVGESSIVTLSKLQEEGFLSNNLKDPRTNSEIENADVIVTLLSNGEYSYTYYNANYVRDNLILWYDGLYHGDDENIWLDRSDNEKDGNLNGFAHDLTSGWQANFLKFSGNNYIQLPSDIGYTNSFSALAYVKFTGSPMGGYHIVFGDGNLELSIPAAGQIRVGVQTPTRFVSNHGSGLANNVWRQVGITFDGTTKKAYIDGELVGSQSVTGTLVSIFTDRTIGRFGNSTVYYLVGDLASAQIYNKALTESEIKQNYKADIDRFNF